MADFSSTIWNKPTAAAAADDVVTKSLRFGGDGYLDRASIGTPTDATKFTASFWIKRGSLDSEDNIIAGGTNVSNWSLLRFLTDNRLTYDDFSDGSNHYQWSWSPELRDVASWYHLLLVWDASQSAAVDKMKLFINGSLVTNNYMLGSPSTSHTLSVSNSGMTQWFGKNATGGSADLQIADAYFIDGTALTTPTSFAEEDETTGQWKPIEYDTDDGAFGDNGFHLDFKDADDIGNDVSGEGNDFDDTNLATSDVLADTPTDNYCVYNAVFSGATGLSEGNLKCTTTARGTFDAMSHASYWEIEANTTSVVGGVISEGGTANTVSVTNGSTFGFRLSAAGALDYTSNGASWTSIATGLSGEQFPYVTGGTTTANFGQSTLSYSVPSGYAVLSTAGMTATIAKPEEHFKTVTYAGTGSASDNDITTVGFQADLTWIKSRNQTYNHALYDSVRGATKELYPSTADVESTDTEGLKSWDGDGFTLGSDGETNDGVGSLVAWNWLAGTSFDAGGGSGTGSKNVTAGFSIAKWEGDGEDGPGGP